ncbi:nudix hydrolase 15, mitochondrial-like [Salvia divinorum]|uniref:Nudix hydrolase 15, mitochondrial-like n=1 Tax=Salvia divinorum TaxID=28513 RepID=A0ABD1HV20_SALDI
MTATPPPPSERPTKKSDWTHPSIVEVVSILHPFYTKRHITVFPVIAITWDISGFSPVLNASEVESVFDVPLEMFLKNENRREEKVELMGDRFLVHYFDYVTENICYTIWALTASILIEAASIIYERLPPIEEQKPKFWSRSRHLNME